jgi:hypothetical protein
LRDADLLRNERQLGHFWVPARYLAILLMPLALSACQDSEDTRSTSFVQDGNDNQPFPNNYRAETLAFLRTYLNNPVGLRDAVMADPVQQTVGGRPRWVSCVRFKEKQQDGTYREARDRAIVFVNGRLDRVAQNSAEFCSAAAYAPFPDLEKMQR